MSATGGSLLRNTRFLQLWIGQGISFVGDFVSTVALVVLIVQITGSATAVGGALVARLLPTLASPLVGVLADRLDRRTILVASDLVRAVLVLGVVFTRDVIVLYVLVFLMGLARTFFNPTVRAAFPGIVGSGDLTRANALVSGAFSVSITVGPALGGLLVATVGVNAAFFLDAVTYLVSAAFLSRIPLPRPRQTVNEGFLGEMRAGFGYLARARVPLAIVVGSFLIILAINTTIPAEIFLAKGTFDAGDAGYGLLVSLWGGGTVLGSALMAVLGDRFRLMPFYFLSVFVGGMALVGTGLAPVFALALGALVVEGVCTGIDNVSTDTILQNRVPDAFRGRVFSVRFLMYSAGEALAYFAGGLIVDAYGPRLTYLFAGIAAVAAGLIVLLLVSILPEPTRKGDRLTQHARRWQRRGI